MSEQSTLFTDDDAKRVREAAHVPLVDELQAVMDRRHELFRRAVLGGEEALLPAFREANREYLELQRRERESPAGRQKQMPAKTTSQPSRL